MDMLDKGMIHQQKTAIEKYTSPNSAKFKIYELLILGIIHLIFSSLSTLQVTKFTESKIIDKERLLHSVTFPIFKKFTMYIL
jgi:hypothetical protein